MVDLVQTMPEPRKSLTNHILMVEPLGFGSNPETCSSNVFQVSRAPDLEETALARQEFEVLVETLMKASIDVLAIQPSQTFRSPDAHFPNNWLSTHSNGTLVLYPMLSPLRRQERLNGALEALRELFELRTIIDLTGHERFCRYLEGTGSLVFDRVNGTAYASLSQRTSQELVEECCRLLNYRSYCFRALGPDARPVYHTNVALALGVGFALLAASSIKEDVERLKIVKKLEESGRELIDISTHQLASFSGNLIQLGTDPSNAKIVISQSGWDALEKAQQRHLERHGDVLVCEVSTIERFGGGSVRCMIAEIFLKRATPDSVRI